MTGTDVASIDEQSRTERVATETPSRTNVGRWERVASAFLGAVLLRRGLQRRSFGGAASALAGGTLVVRGLRGRSRLYRTLDARTAGDDDRLQTGPAAGKPSVERSITVGKPADELGAFWREPDQLNRIVGEFAEVSAAGEDRHHWHVDGPLDRSIEWETRVVEDRPGERLRWESTEGATVPHEVTVRFRPAPGDRGTAVTLDVQYDPPGGSLGNAAMDRLAVVTATLAGRVLGRFKSLAETGEVPTIEKNPSARGSGDLV